MKYQSSLFFCFLLGLLMTFGSCVKDNDMELENIIEPTSTVSSNLTLSRWDAPSFVDLNESKQLFRTDTTYLELTNSTFLMDQVSKANLTFNFKNSLEREFKIEVEFLNDLDEVTFSLQIPVSSGTKEKPMAVETHVVIEIAELVTFKEATKQVYKISMLPDDEQLVLEIETEGTLELRSDATYFLNF